MSAAPRIVLGGHDINDRFRISDISRPFPSARLLTEEIPGMDGEYVIGSTMGARSVSFRLWAFSCDHSRLVQDMADLATWLLTPDPLQLSISDEGGRVRTVHLDGDLPFDEYEEKGSMLVTLKQPDPYCKIGPMQSFEVPSGGSATFYVRHDYPALFVSAQSAVYNSSTGLWGVRFDEGDYLRVALASSTARTVSIDTSDRKVLVAGAVSMVTLDSDWPRLRAGRHTVRMDQGTGAAVVSWQERSL